MKKKSLFNLSIILTAFVLMACTCNQRHIYYSPPAQNVPLLKEKEEINAAFGIADGSLEGAPLEGIFCGYMPAKGGYFQGAYSPKQNIGLALNFMSLSLTKTYTENNNGHVKDYEGSGKGFALDGSVGYYTTLAKLGGSEDFKKLTRHIVLEAYGGLGYSAQHHIYRDSIYKGKADLNAAIFFVQPAIGFNNNWLTLAVSLRMNNFYFHSVNYEYPSNYPGSAYATEEMNSMDYLKANRLQSFIEPGFTIKAGWKYVKLNFQYCLSSVLNSGQSSNAYETERVTLGLNLTLAPRFKKKDAAIQQ